MRSVDPPAQVTNSQVITALTLARLMVAAVKQYKKYLFRIISSSGTAAAVGRTDDSPCFLRMTKSRDESSASFFDRDLNRDLLT